MHRSLPVRAAVAVLALALTTSACSGDDGSGDDAQTPEEVLAEAKTTFDETSGVAITLSTDDLPEGLEGLIGAEGVGTRAPAFEGTITVRYAGFEPNVPVVAVDDVVHAKLPLSSGWSDIDPEEYGAPDPARLMDPDSGFSSLLPATTDLEQGEQVRGGTDNRDVLTEYTGTVPGSTVKNIIPTASGDFDAAYTVSDDGELREVVLTGVFYPDSESMTYTIGFSDYGTSQDITAP
ncbi:LppX_LprAFG lipoprotein [Nocardioides sp. zg-DK7169]|uniref:LppX_LprAFG lipoprotein n=1 Tax=Nocardioides sp. zg-DK7169 TaxID=2736600 RepID=UPI001557AACB|nr:LppX_LprAFG lipoprotein [Nocardioides sp. zg-DK7169]NPC95286.1 LppX_LprAFG lipoprotein [Nocardioides sp. zg-DK7169]